MKIVITGASAGIGAAVARRFAKEKHELILLSRRKEENLGVTAYSLDVSSRSEVEKIFQKIGPIDVLVNNAGVAPPLEPIQNSHLDEWEQCINTNIKGVVYCTHAAIKGMVEQDSGHIVNLGSIAGTYPYPGGNVYCATKAFVHQFSLCLRSDLLGTNVRVSCIEPGLVGGTDFSITRNRGDVEKAKKIYEKTLPLTPEDIADIIYYVVNAPTHVNINTIEVMPTMQAFSHLTVHRN